MSDSSEPGGLDVTVLRHLRGFPDELQRFGNIVKQAHGRSAVEFFLSRPTPADSFLAALCRAARDGDDVVTVIDAADMLGRPAADLLTPESEAALPPPLWGTGRHRLWRRAEMMQYARRAGAARGTRRRPAEDRVRMARLALRVRCAACGHEFDTGIRMDERNFARATFAANYHVCPACGHRGTYGKNDYTKVAPASDAGQTGGA